MLARWSAFDYYPADQRPYVGILTRTDPSILGATGYAKWGITTAAGAAMIFRDIITDQPNPWADTFDARRWDIVKSIPGMLAEQVRGSCCPQPACE